LWTASSGSTAKPALDVSGCHRLVLDVQPRDRPVLDLLAVISADVVATAVPVSATNNASIAIAIAGDMRTKRANSLVKSLSPFPIADQSFRTGLRGAFFPLL
jgi:hypothetical protein